MAGLRRDSEIIKQIFFLVESKPLKLETSHLVQFTILKNSSFSLVTGNTWILSCRKWR